MTDLESPGSSNPQGLKDIENAEFSWAEYQFSTPNTPDHDEAARAYQVGAFYYNKSSTSNSGEDKYFLDALPCIPEGDFAAPIDPSSSHPPQRIRNDLRRKTVTSNHKGVHFRQRNKKFVARLCLPGGKSRKLELGEYNNHDEAARAYQVGAFYYNKLSTSNSGEDTCFLDALPCVPGNLSDAEKLAWVRDIARHSAATIGISEGPPTSASKTVLGSACSSFDVRPSTPAQGDREAITPREAAALYATQGSCGNCQSVPTTPTTSGSAAPGNGIFNMFLKTGVDLDGDFPVQEPDDTTIDRHKRKHAAPHNSSEITGFNRPNKVQTLLNKQTAVAGHQVVSQVKMTDSILFALYELRKQGWEYTLKSRSPSSVRAGVLFSVLRGPHAAPALLITDIITNALHELREQGWEVHLQPHGGGNAELRSEICSTPTGSAAQNKPKNSKFPAFTLAFQGSFSGWIHAPQYKQGHDVQVMVKFSYSKQRLQWQVLENGRKKKIEIHWSDILGMKASYKETQPDHLMIEVSSKPLFFEDTSPQPMMYTSWQACTDFTGGSASCFNFHQLQLPEGVLKEHYEKLVHWDPRLKAAVARGVRLMYALGR